MNQQMEFCCIQYGGTGVNDDCYRKEPFPVDMILVCSLVRGASTELRNLDQMMGERGLFADHISINRWVIRFLRLFERALRKHTGVQ